MSYEYDIFLSYPRGGAIGAWVRELFHPMLKARYPDLGTVACSSTKRWSALPSS